MCSPNFYSTCSTHSNTIADPVHLLMATAHLMAVAPSEQDNAPCHSTKTAQEWPEEHDGPDNSKDSLPVPWCQTGHPQKPCVHVRVRAKSNQWLDLKWVCSGIHMNARTQCFPAEHCIVLKLSLLLTSLFSGFKVVSDW